MCTHRPLEGHPVCNIMLLGEALKLSGGRGSERNVFVIVVIWFPWEGTDEVG